MGRQLIQQFDIDETLLFVTGNYAQVLADEDLRLHNAKMKQAMQYLRENLPTMMLFQQGENEKGKPQTVCYSIKEGSYAGMAIINGPGLPSHKAIEKLIVAAPDNDYIKAMLFRFAETHPDNIIK